MTPLVNGFLRVRSFVTALPTFEIILAGVAFCLALGWGWLHEHDAHVREATELQSKLAAAEARGVTWTKQLVLVDTVVRHDSVRVTRTTARVDTLWRQVPETLLTKADTDKALDALPVLRRSTDSAIAACSEFQISCAAYRRVTDSLVTSLRDERDILKRQLGIAEPGKYHSVLTGAKYSAAACVAVSLWIHKPCWALGR